jgi:MFS family permease
MEIVPIGIASGAFAFNGPFVLKLGGSSAMLGAMAALPALMVILFTFPAARFMERTANRKPWIVGSLALSRMIYLFIAMVPWLLPPEARAIAVVALIVAQAVPLALFNTAFLALIAEICPPDRRSMLFALRTTLLSASVAIGSIACGFFLDLIAFPLNHQLLNLFGFGLAQYSTVLVGRMHYPPANVVAPAGSANPVANKPARLSWAEFKTFARANRTFVNFNLVTLICWLGAWGAAPLYTIYFVRELGLSNSWLGLNSTLAQIAVVLSAPLWQRLIRAKSDMWVLLRTVVLTGLYPWLLVLFPWPTPLLLAGFANTLNDTAIGITHPSIFFDIIPEARRTSFIAAHTTLMNFGAMIAPLLTAPLADLFGVSLVLLACGIFRFGGGLLFWVLPMRTSQSTASKRG